MASIQRNEKVNEARSFNFRVREETAGEIWQQR